MSLIRIHIFFLLSWFTPLLVYSQNEFPRDTGFNIRSNYIKTKKKIPEVTPVSNVKSPKFLSLWNQTYRTRRNRNLRIDIFIPNRKENETYACVLLIHGGGWRSGSKENMVPLAQQLALKGYVTASVEQRLSMEAPYPAAPHDLKEAIKFLKHNAAIYRIDTTKMAVLGASSGATMASLMALTGNNAKFDDPHSIYPNVSAKVQALINIDGIIDFRAPAETGNNEKEARNRPATLFLGESYFKNPKLWVEASPITYADASSPPCLYINSTYPRFAYGREQLFSILQQHNIYHEQHTISENIVPHGFWLLHPWCEETQKYIENFLHLIF